MPCRILNGLDAASSNAMSDDHKAALGRWATEAGGAPYLEALEANKPKRGRKRTPDSIQQAAQGDRGRAGRAPIRSTD